MQNPASISPYALLPVRVTTPAVRTKDPWYTSWKCKLLMIAVRIRGIAKDAAMFDSFSWYIAILPVPNFTTPSEAALPIIVKLNIAKTEQYLTL